MKKIASALTLIIAVALLTSASAAAYCISVNKFQAENSLPTATSAPTSAPTPNPTPTPPPTSLTTTPTQTPTPTPFVDLPYTEGGWLPLGVFGPTSPTNQTYNTTSLTLNVMGTIIVGWKPTIDYSLDGGPRTQVPVELTPLGTTEKPSFQIRITGSVALPPLANGSHVIVLYGDLGSQRCKATVYFEVEGT
jgi:hypothetical protein